MEGSGHDNGASSATAFPWADRQVSVADLSWHIAEAGSGPLLLLLHGTGGSVHSWNAILPFLAPHLRVVAIDLPGHGGTTYPGFDRVSLVEMARQVRALLDAQRLEPAMVVGHSAGAAIMLQLAADGALPSATVLVGVNAALLAPHPALQELMRGSLGSLFRSRPARAFVRSVGTAGPLIELLLSTTGSRLTPEQEAAYVRTFTDPEHVEAAYAMMASWDLAPLVASLPRIGQPTLYIVGARDAWVPPRVAHEACARMTRAQVVTIAAGGHLVHEECPADVATHILSVLRTPPGGASPTS